ncbi:Citrate-proton symporter [Beijerinckiaceae bacterium RH AL1]|nr:tricarballylate/proton symporter TcuC [Beijerinckiaceae bacterium]VVB45449.1 Citrate-proton symporter [Beijerinckiaceae bacterium RH CH11]VVB45526.1 Citrate-proton symporter [Beijerinckiaceae bacterium RH AL8]VVC54871.1 Citrate-proton symporter [Beijerinckiaceae bacterium RH AL1]
MTRRETALAVVRVTSGNFLEMFDFFLFGFYAKPIGDAFFPAHDPVSRLLLAFLTFGAAFLMRPLGAILLGAYVDKVGRRRGLVVTLAIMAAGTLTIALTPSFASLAAIAPALGYAAPLLVLAGRLAQGFSAGVELGGVSVYLAEMAPPGRRGFLVAFQSASQQVAVVVAALVGFALERTLGAPAIAAWGWRLPFLAGCAIIPLLFWIRSSLAETEAFRSRTPPDLATAIATLFARWRVVLVGMLLVAMTTASFYLITVYTPTFGQHELHLDPGATLLIACAVGVLNFCVLPAAGALSDRVGRRPLLIACTVLMLLTAYPALAWLAAAPSVSRMLLVELWLALVYASYNGAMVVALTEAVPPAVRTAGFSLAYSLATALFGGMTPAVSQSLIAFTGDKAAPGIWLSAAAALSLAAALALRPEGQAQSSL